MNKNLKGVLLFLNVVMFILAICWALRDKDYEPIILAIGQIIALLCLIFENQAAKVLTRNTTNKSDVKINVNPGDNIKVIDTSDSKVEIRTK